MNITFNREGEIFYGMYLIEVMYLLDLIPGYKKAYRNWVSVLYNRIKARKLSDKWSYKIKVILRSDGKTLEINPGLVDLYALLLKNPNIKDIGVEYNEITFTFENHKLKFINPWKGDLKSAFGYETYKFLNPKDEVVIDIGANIGDSPIYFCVEGAKKVIALEPYSLNFELLTENININDCTNKIEPLNAGYGKDGLIKIDERLPPEASSDLKESKDEKGKLINLYSLKTILSMFNVKEAVLKMDCEGCEYNLLNEDSDTIRRFKRIQIEYHYGYEELYNYLKNNNFVVKYTKPMSFYNPHASNPNMKTGYIYATRKEN